METTTSTNYTYEVQNTWGNTLAYQEYAQKSKQGLRAEDAQLGKDMMNIFSEFGTLQTYNTDPTSPEAQAVVKRLQSYITEHFYTCTNEILANLGAMYAHDTRFRANIDAQGGVGTARFAQRAIKHYCS